MSVFILFFIVDDDVTLVVVCGVLKNKGLDVLTNGMELFNPPPPPPVPENLMKKVFLSGNYIFRI